jgi:hypothetical protein
LLTSATKSPILTSCSTMPVSVRGPCRPIHLSRPSRGYSTSTSSAPSNSPKPQSLCSFNPKGVMVNHTFQSPYGSSIITRAYSASKSALARLNDTCRIELTPFSIHAVELTTNIALRISWWNSLGRSCYQITDQLRITTYRVFPNQEWSICPIMQIMLSLDILGGPRASCPQDVAKSLRY